MTEVEFTHAHLFCGLGAAARGMNKGQARVGTLTAKFRCLGGIDVDPAAVRDFSRLAGVPGTCLDLFSREQFVAFHGREPDPDWREAGPADLHSAFGHEHPNVVFLSAPCKGFSGLLPEKSSRTAKYQALNKLTLRGIWLMLEAYRDDPVELVVFENVPRIATRGRYLLDQIVGLLESYGYAVAETTHDCGELGGLAQSRKRFLLVARHMEKVPPFLYEPPKRSLRGVGEVIGKLPLPGPEPILPMHRVPALQWKTWVRLAFVEAGSDWRSLNKLEVEDGFLRDFGIAPETDWNSGVFGVREWTEPTGTVAGRSSPTNGAFSVADPRATIDPERSGCLGVKQWCAPSATITSQRAPGQGQFSVADPRVEGAKEFGGWGMKRWDEPSRTITGQCWPGQGKFSVSDPRMPEKANRQNGFYRVVAFDSPSGAITGAKHVGGAAMSVADPRSDGGFNGAGKYRVAGYGEAAGTVIAASTTGQGAFALADPRCNWSDKAHGNKLAITGWRDRSGTVTGSRAPYSGGLSVADPRPNLNPDQYAGQGYYGIVPWWETAGSVTASASYDNGKWSVADPRLGFVTRDEAETVGLPEPSDQVFAMIRAMDGTWHRPFTTLELAALQSLVDPEETLELDGLSDSAWRERIGNAVPCDAAAAMAGVFGRTLLLAMTGETFMLSSEPIWVRPIAVALAVDQAVRGAA